MTPNLLAIKEWCLEKFGTAFEMSVSGEQITIHDRPRAMTDDERAQFESALSEGTLPTMAWSQIRAQRATLLANSDWTQALDSPLTITQRQAWSDYRQQLRDLPQQFTGADAVEWPTAPDFSAAIAADYNGSPCYSGADVDAESIRRVYEMVLPDQPTSLQSTALVNVLGDVQAAVLVLLDPNAETAARIQAQTIIDQNVQLKAAIDAIWAEGQEIKTANGW